MSRRLHFAIRGRLDSAGPEVHGSLVIERHRDPGVGGIVIVRRARCRRIYKATLVGLADLIVSRELAREARDRRAARRGHR